MALRATAQVLALTLAVSPAWAQVSWPSANAPPGTPPAEQPNDVPLLGVQPRLPAPASGAGPPLPPAPSQTHIPLPSSPVPAGTRLGFEFHPSFDTSGQYSDNFFLASTNRKESFRSMITPGLLVGINGPQASGTVSGKVGVAQDTVDTLGELHYFPSAAATLKYAWSPRLSLSLSEAFARSDEPALANQFGLKTQRNTFDSNQLGVSADWLIDVFATQAYYQSSTFSGQSNTASQIGGADVGFPLGKAMALKGGYEFSYSTTTGSSTSDGGSLQTTGHLGWGSIVRQISPLRSVGIQGTYAIQSLNNTRIWNASVFSAFELPGRLSLSGSLGYGVLTADSGEFSTVTSHTSLSYQLGPAVISLAGDSDFSQTFLQGENFGITLTRSYTGAIDYALTPTLHARARGSYSENEFTGIGNTTTRPDQRTITGSAALAWQLRPWLRMAIDYTYTRYYAGSGFGSGTATIIENRGTLRLDTLF